MRPRKYPHRYPLGGNKKYVLNPQPHSYDFNTFYHQHATAIFAYLLLHARSREDAEDLLLEVFLGALKSSGFSLLDEEHQRAWLYRVSRNKIIDRYRRAARLQFVSLEQMTEMLLEEDEQSPEQLALRREAYAQLAVMVQRLSPAQQEILRLRFANGLHCTEIATILGKRESTVRTMLSRTLNALRALYKEEANI